MDSQNLPKHEMLVEETETDVGSRSSHSTNIELNHITQDNKDEQQNKQGDQGLEKNNQESNQLVLTIKKLNGEPICIPYTEDLKQININGLKQRAFPQQVAEGYSIRFIYRGRLVRDDEILGSLEFVGNPVMHAQINPPANQQGQQQNAQPQGADIENQQFQGVIPPNQYNNFQALAAQMIQQHQQQAQNNQQQQQQQQAAMNSNTFEMEGTTCDFWFGFFLVFFLDFVGLFAVFCCYYPKKTKKGAMFGFVARTILKVIFFKEEDYQEQ
ncbi:hypothetical protein ABPG74_005124 [Tetrahymena malaccensis]